MADRELLVIVDMVNGFINEGALSDVKINEITPNILELIGGAVKSGIPIVAFRDCHAPNDVEFESFPVHCLKGSSESELIPELLPFTEHFKVIDKCTTNGFETAEFMEYAKANSFQRVIITGCCTDICIEQFATSYLKHLKEEGQKTELIVPKNAVATFDSDGHSAKLESEKAFAAMRRAGIRVTRCYSFSDKKYNNLYMQTDNKYLNLFKVDFESGGKKIPYEFASRRKIGSLIIDGDNAPDAVRIIPYVRGKEGIEVVLIREFRYPINDFVYAVPAGLIDGDEQPEEAARRELREEIGATVLKLEMTEETAFTSAGMTDECLVCFEAEVELNAQTDFDESEDIQAIKVNLDELKEILDSEKFCLQSKLLLRGFYYKCKLAGTRREK